MNPVSIRSTGLALFLLGLGYCAGSSHFPDHQQQPVADADRLKALEQRVDSLESILFATRQIELRDARRRLQRARQQLVDSRALFNQGILADSQLEQDRFEVLIAEQELELASQPGLSRVLVSGLDLLDAQRRLENARQNLRYSQTLNDRGYGSLTQVRNAEEELDAATEAVRLAEQQAAAARDLDAAADKSPRNLKTEPSSPGGGDRKQP